jgi:hypothetical protein
MYLTMLPYPQGTAPPIKLTKHGADTGERDLGTDKEGMGCWLLALVGVELPDAGTETESKEMGTAMPPIPPQPHTHDSTTEANVRRGPGGSGFGQEGMGCGLLMLVGVELPDASTETESMEMGTAMPPIPPQPHTHDSTTEANVKGGPGGSGVDLSPSITNIIISAILSSHTHIPNTTTNILNNKHTITLDLANQHVYGYTGKTH